MIGILIEHDNKVGIIELKHEICNDDLEIMGVLLTGTFQQYDLLRVHCMHVISKIEIQYSHSYFDLVKDAHNNIQYELKHWLTTLTRSNVCQSKII